MFSPELRTTNEKCRLCTLNDPLLANPTLLVHCQRDHLP